MTENFPPENSDLGDEFRNLGKNIGSLLRTAWKSPERQKLQDDIESGLADLVATLSSAAADFKQSDAGQHVQSDIEDIKQRIQSGEIESKIRSELQNILRKMNAELEKGIEKDSDGN